MNFNNSKKYSKRSVRPGVSQKKKKKKKKCVNLPSNFI